MCYLITEKSRTIGFELGSTRNIKIKEMTIMKMRLLISKILLVTLVMTSCISIFGVISVRAASTLTVGPGKMYATPKAAYTAAVAGDTIEIYADGTYFGTNAYLLIQGKNDITFRGVAVGTAARPKMQADPHASIIFGQAIWVIGAQGITVDNIEFDNATSTSKNGAGIKVGTPTDGAGGNITITNCFFYNNQTNFITAANANVNLTMLNCEFSDGGYGSRSDQEHNCYVGDINTFTLRYSYSHNVKNGMLVKTRAQTSYIEYNRLTDEGTSNTYTSNYNIDVPNAGDAYIIGNLFEQNQYSTNYTLLSYCMEGAPHTGRNCYIINNTVVNDLNQATSVFMRTPTTDYGLTVTYKNNIFTGVGTLTSGIATWVQSNNYTNTSPDPGFFVNKAAFDYRLTSAATAVINMGVSPGTSYSGYSLTPVQQYIQKCSSLARPVNGTIDIGAYEY